MSKNITVIGVGRLGLGLALLIEKGGYNVCGVDIFQDYVNCLNNKQYTSNEPGYVKLLNESKNFTATTSIDEGLEFSDIIFIVVQTPNSGGDRFYDHNILSDVLININKRKVENKHIIIGCTVMPKYINEVGELLLSDCANTTLNYNPEFVAQGEIVKGFLRPDIMLVGTNSVTLSERIKELYSSFVLSDPKYCIVTPLESEIIKISINGYITTKLSYANMISDLCDTLGANKTNVLNSIGSDTRIGNKYFRPGYSFGGPCFPRDTHALKQVMDQNNINSDLLAGTSVYNEEHIKFQAQQFLNQNLDNYIFEDVCYKENSKIPIIEQSAKLKIAKILVENGKKVTIQDEIQLINEVKKEYGILFTYLVI